MLVPVAESDAAVSPEFVNPVGAVGGGSAGQVTRSRHSLIGNLWPDEFAGRGRDQLNSNKVAGTETNGARKTRVTPEVAGRPSSSQRLIRR